MPNAVAGASTTDQATTNDVVCPFCANVRSSSVGPCPRCTLEDSASTRQSTAERIGPWFVFQRRNPTAPGLKLGLIQQLARRGHITPRSIIRGPSTAQLWTFASDVRGVAHLFGRCWKCHATLADEVTSQCPSCHASIMFESDPEAFLPTTRPTPVMREVEAPAEASPAEVSASVVATATVSLLDESASGRADEPAPESSRSPSISAAAPHVASTRDPGQTILSARELAAVFQLEVARPSWARRNLRRVSIATQVVLALLVVAGAAAAALLYARPELRQPARERASALLEQARQLPAELSALISGSVSPTPESAQTSADTPTSTTTSIAPMVVASQPNESPVASASSARVESPIVPPLQIPSEVLSGASPARRAEVAPAPTPPPLPTPTPAQLPIEEATILAADLRRSAIDAEARRDWSGAVKLYEQIQSLPRDAHPTDLENRLAQARQRLASTPR